MSLARQFVRTLLGTGLLLSFSTILIGQEWTNNPIPSQSNTPASASQANATKDKGDQTDSKSSNPNGTGSMGIDSNSTTANLQKQLDDINKYLADQRNSESDFSLVLGIGSLILAPGVTDYVNQSNVINIANLGKATPQLLTGISFRTRVPSMFVRFGCPGKKKGDGKGNNQDKEKDKESKGHKVKDDKGGDQVTAAAGQSMPGSCYGEIWQRNPWNAFLTLKFAPGASNPINGYVLGGSFSLAHYLDFLVGFALTPVSEPAPGFRSVAAQFVTTEQKKGLYLNFNPTAMLNNGQNAFDGFPTTNPATGALLYPGNPLATHYRGGVVIGVSIPIAFSAFLKGGAAPPGGTSPPPTPKPSVGH